MTTFSLQKFKKHFWIVYCTLFIDEKTKVVEQLTEGHMVHELQNWTQTRNI